tara:strand:- start:205 stop:609 length:405 start_codon:yes stop_codon:yes gene_type:complete
MLKMNKKYIMKKSELKEYDLLPEIPENKLTKKQKELVWNLYYKYITRKIDNYNYPNELCELPTFKKNWYSGKRTTLDHRKMLVLNQLVELNKYRKTIKNSEINDFLYNSIDSMEHYRTIVKFAYKNENNWTLNK